MSSSWVSAFVALAHILTAMGGFFSLSLSLSLSHSFEDVE